MPRFPIDLKQPVVDRLQKHVQRTNETNGTSYTLLQWITLHLKEVAISEELPVIVERLQQKSQKALNEAIRREQKRLMDSIDR